MDVRVAVIGGTGKTGRAVCAALTERGAEAVPLGRAAWVDLVGAVTGCDAAYLIAPNLHHDEPGYVGDAVEACAKADVRRVVYHSVASPHVSDLAHHLDKAEAEDLVRRSGLDWTILQPGPYLQNFDLTTTVRLPYSADRVFGFLDLADLGEAAATVLLEDGHGGATYELATRAATVAELAAEAGVDVVVERPQGATSTRAEALLRDMFAYYDRHGLPVGTNVLRWLLAR